MAWFSAFVELQIPLEGKEPADGFAERLQRWHGAVAVSPHGWLSAQISIEAETFAHAVEVAQLVTLDAARAAGYKDPELVALEVMTEVEFDLRQTQPDVPELVDAKEAGEILGVSRQRVLQIADRLGGIKIGNSYAFTRAAVETAAKAAGDRRTPTAQS